MCASTRWPFSSSTRNIAFGRGSITVPSTWMPSSLPEDAFSLFLATRVSQHHFVSTIVARGKRPTGARQNLEPDRRNMVTDQVPTVEPGSEQVHQRDGHCLVRSV